MNDDAFLKAIHENPGDDAARLVYADWLEERSDPRGTYLRLESTLTTLRGNTREYLRTRKQLHALRKSIDPTWARSVSLRKIACINHLVNFLREHYGHRLESPSLDSIRIPKDFPYGLAIIYRELGALLEIGTERPPFGTQDHLASFRRLKRIDGEIEFAWENQGNWSCRCKLGEEDPPVYSDADYEGLRGREFVQVCPSLNHFLITFGLREAVFSAPFLFRVQANSPQAALVDRINLVPLWLQGKYVYGDLIDFYAIPQCDAIIMSGFGQWLGSHSADIASFIKKGVKFIQG